MKEQTETAMKKDKISYYCFNKACQGSVYHSDSIHITDLPFTAHTLAFEHHCNICGSKLISVVDIDLQQALAPKIPVSA